MSLFLLALMVVACGPSDRTRELHKAAVEMIGALPKQMPGSEKDSAELKVLGARLYNDTILSRDGTVSCNTCHRLDGNQSGTDNLRVSKGVGGKTGTRNSPTVWNAGLHVAQFWDGRAKSLAEQAGMPILNPVEMAMPGKRAVVARLRGHKDYPTLFRKAFPRSRNPVTYGNIQEALAAFERTLITTDRFDRFIRGDLSALNGRERKGLSLFAELGCVSCHNGPLLGGNSFRRVGGVIAYENVKDTGRFALSGIEAEKFVFKVPSLRNVAVTAPYFHDGSRPTLQSAVRTMARLQLGRNLNRLQVNYITDFLKTLTDPRLMSKDGKK